MTGHRCDICGFVGLPRGSELCGECRALGIPPPGKPTKHDSGKTRYSLLATGFVREMAELLTREATTPGHTDNGWQEVPEAHQRYYDALNRHLEAWWSGERNDAASGAHHLVAVAVNAMILWWHDNNDGGSDE